MRMRIVFGFAAFLLPALGSASPLDLIPADWIVSIYAPKDVYGEGIEVMKKKVIGICISRGGRVESNPVFKYHYSWSRYMSYAAVLCMPNTEPVQFVATYENESHDSVVSEKTRKLIMKGDYNLEVTDSQTARTTIETGQKVTIHYRYEIAAGFMFWGWCDSGTRERTEEVLEDLRAYAQSQSGVLASFAKFVTYNSGQMIFQAVRY